MGRLLDGLVRGCLLCGLLLGLVACGANVPRSVVDSALQFEIAHAKDAPITLVGVELLDEWSQVRSVKVQTQTSVEVPIDGERYAGVNVHGTYTLAVRTPMRKSRYKRTEPFTLTLVRDVDPELEGNLNSNGDHWLLAELHPSTPHSLASEWTLIDFLPLPEQPESPPTLANPDELTNSDELTGEEQVFSRDNATSRQNSQSDLDRSNPAQLSPEETSDIVGAFETLGE
ncbi:MAG: hypothetical protein AAF974_00780 [Cyanobacteria bacterium P01_E01_bin.34]